MERIAQCNSISGQVYPFFWEDVERIARSNSISGQWSGDIETRLTNVAAATKVAASRAAVGLEEIPSHSSIFPLLRCFSDDF